MECGGEAAALEYERTAVAGAAALQGAFGTRIFRADENTADEASRGREKTRIRCAARATARVCPATAFQASPPLGERVDRDGAFTSHRGPGDGVRSRIEIHPTTMRLAPSDQSLRPQRFRGVHGGGAARGQIGSERGRRDEPERHRGVGCRVGGPHSKQQG